MLRLFLIVISTIFLLNLKLLSTNGKSLVLGRAISGFIIGLIGTGGALRAALLTGLKMEKERCIATAAVIALGTDEVLH
jgi:uncharacterized protein